MNPALPHEADDVIGARVMAALQCDCGLPNPPFIAPGHEPKTFGNERGQSARGWCAECWPWARKAAA